MCPKVKNVPECLKELVENVFFRRVERGCALLGTEGPLPSLRTRSVPLDLIMDFNFICLEYKWPSSF